MDGKSILRAQSQFHVWIYRATNGAIGGWLPPSLFSSWRLPMCLLTTTGRKSGLKRTTPLLYLTEGDKVILIASQAGRPEHPLWYTNMLANPEMEVQIGAATRKFRARTATSEERAKWWPRAVETYSGYAGYQKKTDREIPVVICEPA